ncbi:glucose-1-phosphate thymidylyltransferase RfbA [Rhodobacteraceae bacterium 2CG4]|uniref:Glucose-1-phosphate thymidylyltransferase n=1 Tax=Halovulum marinum TaxID=2662447 RepID=A0A6L5Z6K1_9RHOB|nr:glucose-1-phosphate thymidylyltransferase RfbA [Halovulum marinum]MSU91730.1 glucose-1-phosphate thymidylyltransferase RfbA [Halovulum marinum]
MNRKGIILAGGSGTRLYPITMAVSKQLMPLYDKPMIYYPLTVLMLAGLREVAIITTPQDRTQFQRLLGDGSQWGMALTFIEQPAPEGLAQAYVLAEDFLAGAPSAMVLGDNIFYGHGLQEVMLKAARHDGGGTVFGYQVRAPERYGVLDFDAGGKVTRLVEKPQVPPSDFALTGLYFLDGRAPGRAATLTPSARGELEIVDLLQVYLEEGSLEVALLGRGYGWLDTGTHDSLLEAGAFVQTLEKRQGLKIGCPEEVAYLKGWIDADAVRELAKPFLKTEYGQYLVRMVDHKQP